MLLVVLLCTFSLKVFTQDNKDQKFSHKILTPDYLNFQFAGNTGLGSFGIGYLSKDGKKRLGFNYGHLPSWVNGVRVHTLSAKGDFQLAEIRLAESIHLNGYAGTNFIYSLTHNTFVLLPRYYMKNYYLPNAFHFAPFVGMRIGRVHSTSQFSVKALYFELGTLDTYILNNFKQSFRHFSQSWNLCIGITLPLSP